MSARRRSPKPSAKKRQARKTPRKSAPRTARRRAPEVADAEVDALLRVDLLVVLALYDRPLRVEDWRREATHGLQKAGLSKATLSKEVVRKVAESAAEEGLVLRHGSGGKNERFEGLPWVALQAFEAAHEVGRLLPLADALFADRGRGIHSFLSPSVAIQLALVTSDEARMERALQAATYTYGRGDALGDVILSAIGPQPSAEALATLPDDPLRAYLSYAADTATRLVMPIGDAVFEAAASRGARLEQLALGRYLALRGDDAAIEGFHKLRAVERARLRIISRALRGDASGAVEAGDEALASRARLKQPLLEGVEAIFHILSLAALSHERPDAWSLVERYAARMGNHYAVEGFPIAIVQLFHAAMMGDPLAAQRLDGYVQARERLAWLDVIVLGCAIAWGGERRKSKGLIEYLARLAEGDLQATLPGASRFALEVIRALRGEDVSGTSVVGSFRRKAAWEVRLDALMAIAEPTADDGVDAEPAFEPHLLWDITRDRDGDYVVTPRHIKSAKSKKGTKVALRRLVEGDFPDATEADRRVVNTAETHRRPWEAHYLAYELTDAALGALVGHPRVRFEGQPVEVKRGQVGIVASKVNKGILVSLDPMELHDESVLLRPTDDGALVVFERTEATARFLGAVGEDPLLIPKEGADRLGHVLGVLGSELPIRTEGDVHVAREEIDGATTPVVALGRASDGVSVRLAAAPLGVEGPLLPPGRGREEAVWQHADGVTSAKRDLPAEVQAVEALRRACPLLDALLDDAHVGHSGDLVTALDLLSELESTDADFKIAWPSGQPLSAPEKVQWGQVRTSVKSAEEWMDVDLEVDVDEATVLGFRTLMKHRIGASRYAELDDGRVLELSANLARSLEAMEGLGRSDRGKSLQVSAPMLPLLEELVGEGEVAMDKRATKRLAAMNKALESTPRRPRALSAELRDYQREGFVWMARLADAGLGAVLADDMGLGKTVQSLALLCRRAKLGPALIVAPTSVAPNWVDEARRFAPGLRLRPLAGSDRDEALASPSAGDVLIVSYGLLVREKERLSAHHFATVVFDEAHALKNSASQRSRVASSLSADFRLSLTGTPIENHLGEMWSLMQVTLPGMLGSEARFQKRFVGPIERGDRHAVADLREMLRPFILRRTKAEVLDELPPRTEITHRVTPSAEARSFYEALRRDSLERVAGATQAETKGGRMQVLAEIQRLRQAAVDPRLVDAELGPAGGKYDALLELLEPLRDEGHRALVFSQFLGSQDAIRERLDAAGFTHLSIDGSTPSATRKKRIDAFQNGEADVFVMSLKAGGVGVNLTGADYVFHLDPWWNPAVEDQATGRAHRIGQHRAVTVYRLITVGTIEEKILELHDRKRELAADLLEGMGEATKLGVDELREMLTS